MTATSTKDGRIVCRDASFFKVVNAVINTADEIDTSNPEPQKVKTETTQEDIKEKTLRDTAPGGGQHKTVRHNRRQQKTDTRKQQQSTLNRRKQREREICERI